MRILFCALFLFPALTSAQSFVGTFVTVKGDVKVLRAPGSQNTGQLLVYEGQKYAYEQAKIGRKVHPGEIIQSGPDGRAKLVYPNGDHFVVSPATAMVVPSITDKGEKDESSLKLLYGKMRSLVSKSGPRKNMKVVTPTAVAGVRGTDFFTRSNPVIGTELTVIRGKVAVASQAQPAKAVTVKTGFTAETPTSKAPPKVVAATREELIEVQTESSVKTDKAELEKLPEPLRNEVLTLQEQTKKAVLNDIKLEDPKMYEDLQQKKNIEVQEINTAVVAKLYEKAPSENVEKKGTLSLDEIKAIGEDTYDKYFKKADEN